MQPTAPALLRTPRLMPGRWRLSCQGLLNTCRAIASSSRLVSGGGVMRSRLQLIIVLVLTVTMSGPLGGQQSSVAYRYANRDPAYAIGQGPIVCVDEGHSNLHTLSGTYAPLGTLLRDDGYQVQPLTNWSPEALGRCRVVVIANALAQTNVGDRALPHPPAFNKSELDVLAAWLTGGGSLLLIADHAPFPGAAKDLGLLLGVDMLDAFAAASAKAGVLTVFGSPDIPDAIWRQYAADRNLPPSLFDEILANPGSISAHPIMRGRNEQERVPWVVTFTGHAFHASDRVEPLLRFGPRASAGLDRPDAASFPIAGWLQAAAINFGKGRAVVLGEASACTAQEGGPRRIPTGMNTPIAPHNARFCLNVLHWLSGILSDGPANR